MNLPTKASHLARIARSSTTPTAAAAASTARADAPARTLSQSGARGSDRVPGGAAATLAKSGRPAAAAASAASAATAYA